MGNLFAELKRRHIYRVAAAYAVVAWVLIQLIGIMMPAFDLPPWTARATFWFLGIGFPVVLIFAWVHELGSAPAGGTPSDATTNKLDWVLIGALVVVIALVSYQQLAPTTGVRTAQRTSVASGAVAGEATSVEPPPDAAALARQIDVRIAEKCRELGLSPARLDDVCHGDQCGLRQGGEGLGVARCNTATPDQGSADHREEELRGAGDARSVRSSQR